MNRSNMAIEMTLPEKCCFTPLTFTFIWSDPFMSCLIMSIQVYSSSKFNITKLAFEGFLNFWGRLIVKDCLIYI